MWEQITNADRAKGIGGGGTVDYGGGPTSMADVVGCLASKWATPDPNTWVLDIREGVYWMQIPNNEGAKLVNGRQMTPDDIIASLEANRDQPKSWAKVAEGPLHKNMTVEKTGAWQLTVHVPVNPSTAYLWLMGGGGSQFIWPKEWIPKYYEVNDWKVTVGTGSYYISDWVDNSQMLLKRNGRYWETSPSGAGKGDKLPYIDTIKINVVPDTSAQQALLRTHKAEMYSMPAGFGGSYGRDAAQNLLKTNPEMKVYKTLSYPQQVGMRRDKPDLPYKDINVRKALMLATDMNSILKSMMGGEGEILASPASPLYPTCYTPLDQLPASTRELYTYNLDKAKQLLKDAGYEKGFNAKLVLDVSITSASDMAETLKAQWAKVGVKLTIEPKESGTFQGMWSTRNYDELLMTMNCGGDNALFVRYSFGYFRAQNSYNISYVDDPEGSDPTIEAAFQEETKYINVDFAKLDKIHKDTNPYILSQAFLIPTPAPYTFRMWKPWLRDYVGEGSGKDFIAYVWIDPVIKAQYVK
jgi:ABC-type transport system substrate-binding protein